MKKRIEVTIYVDVSVDETTFTPEFLAEFETYMYPFETVEQHMCYLGQLAARGLLGDFVHGYGWTTLMGIEAEVIDSSISAFPEDAR